MGSLAGHVLPGTFFAIFGSWFTYQIFLKYFLCQRASAGGGGGLVRSGKSRNHYYRNSCSFPCPCCRSLPLEGVLKIVAAVVGMTGEFVTGFVDGRFAHLPNAQHMTMFFFFGLNGATDVMVHYRLPAPPDLDYVSAILAFIMEGLLFFYHLHGRPPMDVQVHMLLFYVTVACAASTALEMCHKTNVLPALGRAYFIMLQGTWFYQIGFVLYPPTGAPWDTHDHHKMMMVTLLFTWHNATIFFLMSVAGALVYYRVKVMAPTTFHRYLRHYRLAPHTALEPGNEQFKAMLHDSEDEDV